MTNKLTKEEAMLRSYNETFYTSLKSLSFIKNPLPLEEKLMYHFEQNASASVSSTIGQLESSLEELLKKNKEIKLSMNELREEIKQLKIDIEVANDEHGELYKPQIKILSDALADFVEKQKIENYRLKEEISVLERERTEIQQSIYDAFFNLSH